MIMGGIILGMGMTLSGAVSDQSHSSDQIAYTLKSALTSILPTYSVQEWSSYRLEQALLMHVSELTPNAVN